MRGAHWYTMPGPAAAIGDVRYVHCDHPGAGIRVRVLCYQGRIDEAVQAVGVIHAELSRRLARAAYAAKH